MLLTESKLRQIVKEEYRFLILEQDDIKAMRRINNIKDFFKQAGKGFAEIVKNAMEAVGKPDLSSGQQVVSLSMARKEKEKSQANLRNKEFKVPTKKLTDLTRELKEELVNKDSLAEELLKAIFGESRYVEPLKTMIENLKNYNELFSLFSEAWREVLGRRYSDTERVTKYFNYFSEMVTAYEMENVRFGATQSKPTLRSAKPGEIDLRLINIKLNDLDESSIGDIKKQILEIGSLSKEEREKIMQLFGNVNIKSGGLGTSNEITIPLELSRFLINKGVNKVNVRGQLYDVSDGQPVL